MKKPILYYKPTCPWCVEALDYFDKKGFRPELRDVSANGEHYDELRKLSGQGYVPTLVYGDFVVADFSVDEFIGALEEAPEIRGELGL
mgnify:CR=1 FL=1